MVFDIDTGLKAYEAIVVKEDWDELKECYTEENYHTLGFPITVNRDNAIHMAVHSKGKQPLEHLLDIVKKAEDPVISEMIKSKNKFGNTPLHKAAALGNYEAAKLLVERGSERLEDTNNKGETPLFKAAEYGRTKVMKFLASQPRQISTSDKLQNIHRYRKTSSGEHGHGDSILYVAIQGLHFGTALALLELDVTLADDDGESRMSSLQLLANIPQAFRSAYKTGFWKSMLYFCLPVFDNNSDDDISITDYDVTKRGGIQERPKDLECGESEIIIEDDDDNHKASKTIRFWRFLFQELPSMWEVWGVKRMNKFAAKLAESLIQRDNSWQQSFTEESRTRFRATVEEGGKRHEESEYMKITTTKQDEVEQAPAETDKLEESKPPESSGQPAGGEMALLIAARKGIIEIVEKILRVHPQAIEYCSHMGQNILHVAVLHRQKLILDAAKKMRIPMTNLVQGIDQNGYTILHCAADMTNYSGGTRPGPAYQLQEEIKWFHRVFRLVPPHFGMHHDNKNKTAQELFEEQHQKQLEEAQKWIKDTAQACSTVAVLVATVVFAAAYTLPGGSNERGLPIFLNSPIFMFFAITDVLSLTGSLTSVVMFLSILSSPLELSNFYKSIPQKLTFGFSMLFLSVATAMMAFTATFLLVIRLEPRRWTSTLIYTAAFLPVGMLALTQFPLYVAFMDTLMHISKAIRRILPLNRVRRLFFTRGQSS